MPLNERTRTEPALFSDIDATQHSFADVLIRLHVNEAAGWPDSFGAAMRSIVVSSGAYRPKVLSLFSGAGGLDVGFHDAGFEVVEMIEIDDRFAETLRLNSGADKYLGEVSVRAMDIKEYSPERLPRIDFVIGGPPCQTFSAAGRRAAGVAGISDPRGVLFREYIRLLDALKPAGFLFENVYGLTGAQNGRAWAEIVKSFESLGYKIAHRILDSADYGVPQHRERLFIVGTRETPFLFPRPTHGPDSPDNHPFYTASAALAGLRATKPKQPNGRYGHLLPQIPPGLNYSFFTKELGHPHPVFAWRSKFSDFLYKADPNTPIRTLKAQGGKYTGPFHWESRPFTIDELKRLQTFPDAYQIYGSRQVAMHQIGNSVPPQLARILALSIYQQLFGLRLAFELPYLAPNERLGFRTRKRQLTPIYAAKASEALRDFSSTAVAIKPKRYNAAVSDEFSFQRNVGSLGMRLGFRPNKSRWVVSIKPRDDSDDLPQFEVRILTAAKNSWSLPISEIKLVGAASNSRELLQGFTLLWKGLEYELQRHNLKSDLVQLSGYYQYEPKFCCELLVPDALQSKTTGVLERVVAGHGVRRLLEANDLAKEWSVPLSQLPKYMQTLRNIGYEVRNHNTNPQIPEEMYLIPYCFPTLSYASVQRHKTLH